MSTKKFLPVIVAASIVVGVIIGSLYSNGEGDRPGFMGNSSNKIDALLGIIDNQYVDTVNIADIVEQAMPQILSELDPHSTYISAKDRQAASEELEGSFCGIGVQFLPSNDTIHVMRVIPGGPSDKVGIIAGDRIIAVDDSTIVGADSDLVMRKLKGPRDTKVKVTVLRQASGEKIDFTILRGDIPIKSVDACYMLTDKTGYMKINTFSLSTYEEMLSGIAHLRYQGCQGIIIGLRDNLGGVLEIAIKMVNEFLPQGRLIVYTEGRKSPRQDYYSDGHGTCQGMPVVVLINEASASASEIFSGALQDNDRGTVIGLRSFGKGLVQQPIEFGDGSEVRLTIARYFTPSGRCIQRSYTHGRNDDYNLDILKRYEHGELFSKDSISTDSLPSYETAGGRTVYGGGGIIPDIFIPQDTTGYTSYLRQLNINGLFSKFAFDFTDGNRATLAAIGNEDDLAAYLDRHNVVEDFIRYADKQGVKRRNILIQKSYALIKRFLYASIIYDRFDIEEYIKYTNQTDKTVQRAVEVIEDYGADPLKLPKER